MAQHGVGGIHVPDRPVGLELTTDTGVPLFTGGREQESYQQTLECLSSLVAGSKSPINRHWSASLHWWQGARDLTTDTGVPLFTGGREQESYQQTLECLSSLVAGIKRPNNRHWSASLHWWQGARDLTTDTGVPLFTGGREQESYQQTLECLSSLVAGCKSPINRHWSASLHWWQGARDLTTDTGVPLFTGSREQESYQQTLECLSSLVAGSKRPNNRHWSASLHWWQGARVLGYQSRHKILPALNSFC